MVQVLVLGSIAAARGDGRAVRLGSPLVQRLVAVLVTEAGRPIGRDRLIEVLWGDSPPDGAANNVQVYVSRLRGELGRDTIETSSLGYALAAKIELDSAVFERMLELARATDLVEALRVYDDALELWRGPAFGAFAGEWWARPSANAPRRAASHGDGRADRRAHRAWRRQPRGGGFGIAPRGRPPEGIICPYSDAGVACVGPLGRRPAGRGGLPAPALRAGGVVRVACARPVRATDPRPRPRGGARPSIARALRGYVFGELIAEGAHGAVYAAAQPSLGREVAIKVLRKDRADSPDFIRRFEAEAQFVARLEHPNIVPLYDYWREPGNAYLVMRFLRGGSLADRIARESIPIDDIDLLIERIGDALHSAHGRGVAHRDVRAANVLYDDEGRPYLADFGIALGHEQ